MGQHASHAEKKAKRRSQARRAKADEAKQLERVPWKANHVCKYLIAIYINREVLESNKHPMPFYGNVWRQNSISVSLDS